MSTTPVRPVAVVGHAAIMPEAPTGDTFWANITAGRYSITEVPPERWDPALYFDADHSVPDKTYSTIGGWVRTFEWDPVAWRLPIPPMVASQMDEGQRWALSAARSALTMAGWPGWGVDTDRVAVIIGNAIGGEKHYISSMRIRLPEVIKRLEASPTLGSLPVDVQRAVVEETRAAYLAGTPEITEDTMPGELSNVMAGRIANLFNLRGPNFTTDAACASGLAALDAAVRGLVDHQFDAVVTGGVDRNMGVDAFVKFCKIGALSATGTRPFDAGADGFVMGEGAALFVLKRLEDAEHDGDHVYAVILGIGGSSDGKGKGITAPNPVGQQLAVRRAWESSGQDPATVMAVEAHGTSTRVGDAAELTSLQEVFGPAGLARGSVALGSVKSNIGHLKAAAGTAGLYKMVRSLDEKVLAPSLNFVHPNDNVDWDSSPFAVNTTLRAWPEPTSGTRRAGVSAFGFGGTNYHVVVEEHVPGRHQAPARVFAAAEVPSATTTASAAPVTSSTPVELVTPKVPLRGALVLGGASEAAILTQLRAALDAAKAGSAPAPAAPDPSLAAAAVRVAVDYAAAADLAGKLGKLIAAFETGNPAVFKMLRQQGAFVGRGPAPKVAFLYTGQGSQYVNMLHDLVAAEPVVADTFAEADTVMTPLLGRPLSSFIFSDDQDPETLERLNAQLMQTEITQPAVLATDLSLTRLLAAYGIAPDLVMGHSLGEYGALVAAGSLTFEAALEAVSARGREMTKVSMADNGAMAAVFGPLSEIERIVAQADGYVVIANINSFNQAVVGGATDAVERIVETFQSAGLNAIRIPVSHAFHTSIVAPASDPLKVALARLDVRGPQVPTVANVTGELYPADADTTTMLDYLGRQVASPVQFVRGLQSLYAAGARVFVEVGPKKALQGFVEDVLGSQHDDVLALFTNHPKLADAAAFNQALCGLYAAGLGLAAPAPAAAPAPSPASAAAATTTTTTRMPAMTTPASDETISELGRLFAGVLQEGMRLMGAPTDAAPAAAGPAPVPPAQPVPGPAALATTAPVVITGAALGLPGVEQTFDDENVARILAGQSFIQALPADVRARMVDQRITRLVKDAGGGGSFVTIDNAADVIKLAGRHAPLDVVEQFGIDKARDEALDTTTRLALGAGFDAMRDAGIPLVMRYKTTTLGTQLPDRWGLPEALRDNTGIIFASAFPGYDRFAEAVEAYAVDKGRRDNLLALEAVRGAMTGDEPAAAEADRLIAELRATLEAEPYAFDRRFLFRVLSMGHSQFAEIVGARGPNTQVNAACASTTQALSLAEDWIRAGRCSRVVVISADDATGEHLLPWVTSGFLATGAAATDERVEDAATPFDRRRHGMIVGVGAAALVVESAEAARERGIQPICEVLGAITANSAFHGTRLDVEHIGGVMESLVREAEARGVDRHQIAASTMFVSHETYTPARGGSAAAEVNALRRVFGADADKVVITNTKGFTGHAMGAGIEDVVAIKALETGIVPPVPNYREPDPDLGALNLSTGGPYPVEFALRLAAGFGSQVAMSLTRRTPMPGGARRSPDRLGFAYRVIDQAAWQGWLDRLSGHTASALEVDHRRLRVVDVGAPEVPVAPATQVPVPYPGIAGAAAPAVTLPAAVPAPPAAPASTRAPDPVPSPDAVPAPVTAAVPEAAVDPVLAAVTAIVADLTGYPPELLDPDLDLEADLGVDTVKQAEVFAAVREQYHLERDTTLQLRDFPTLAHVTAWVRDRTGLPEPTTTAPAPAAASPAAASTTAAAPTADPVLAAVTAIVADLTGYPPELLDPDLDLEADLGVDTVKQAEVFAAVREQYHLERDTTLQLRDFPTLAHVTDWVRDRTGLPEPTVDNSTAVEMSTTAPTPAAQTALRLATVRGDLHAIDALPRRIPVPALRPASQDCAKTGVVLDGARVVVMLDEGGVGKALVGRLERSGATALTLDPGVDTADLQASLEGWLAEGPITGVYWLPALDDEGDLDEMDLTAWTEALRRRVKTLYTTMRRLWDTNAFLVSATRLGGRHGYGPEGATCPMGGAVTGFTKSYKKERPEALAKAVDLPASRKTAAVADLLIEETLRDPGTVEVGREAELRWGVVLAEQPFPPLNDDGTPDHEGGMPLTKDTVVVVTGAAGSIVSAITADLAEAGAGTFHLLDLTPTPDPTDTDLADFVTDREGLKATLAGRMKEHGEKATPVSIEKELARIERLVSAQSAIAAVESAGATARYHSVDLTDVDAVAAVVRDIRATSGRVDVLLHAAGVEISRNLPEKEQGEYDLVFDVKTTGWFALWQAAKDLDIAATVVFSSVAGRFGNQGQTDYAAANDLLCKVTSAMRRTRPQTRALALDWTAWGGIGMATRGSIPKIMEMAGVQMLPPEAGVAWIRRELAATAFRGEVVVAGALGLMATEYHESGGVDEDRMLAEHEHGPMVGAVTASAHRGLVVTTTLDPVEQPFLDHHRIDGIPVLPGVMGMEAFAEAAALLAPAGYRVGAVEDVGFLAPVKFYRDEPRILTVTAQVAADEGSTDLLARCTLTAERLLPGQDTPQQTTHFTGTVRLTTAPPAVETGPSVGAPEGRRLTPEEVYALYFHGPAYQVVGAAWAADGTCVARLAEALPDAHVPASAPLVNAPRLVELCFQAAGLWEAGRDSRMALPHRVGSVRVLPGAGEPNDRPLYAVAREVAEGTFDCAVVDDSGAVIVRLDGYRSIPLPVPVAAEVAEPLAATFGAAVGGRH